MVLASGGMRVVAKYSWGYLQRWIDNPVRYVSPSFVPPDMKPRAQQCLPYLRVPLTVADFVASHRPSVSNATRSINDFPTESDETVLQRLTTGAISGSRNTFRCPCMCEASCKLTVTSLTSGHVASHRSVPVVDRRRCVRPVTRRVGHDNRSIPIPERDIHDLRNVRWRIDRDRFG